MDKNKADPAATILPFAVAMSRLGYGYPRRTSCCLCGKSIYAGTGSTQTPAGKAHSLCARQAAKEAIRAHKEEG